MAKQAKEGVRRGELKAEDFQRVMREATRQSLRASEVQAEVGAYIKNQIERYGIHKKAFGTMRQISRLEVASQQEFIRELLRYLLMMDAFKQVDAFDDIRTILQEALETLGSNSARAEADETINALVN
jgi:polyhydroxyalkanoate synthesis regulator phasin